MKLNSNYCACLLGAVPAVDNARDFGRIAAANAISDVYAMGGKVSGLGWHHIIPICSKVLQRVVNSTLTCQQTTVKCNTPDRHRIVAVPLMHNKQHLSGCLAALHSTLHISPLEHL